MTGRGERSQQNLVDYLIEAEASCSLGIPRGMNGAGSSGRNGQRFASGGYPGTSVMITLSDREPRRFWRPTSPATGILHIIEPSLNGNLLREFEFAEYFSVASLAIDGASRSGLVAENELYVPHIPDNQWTSSPDVENAILAFVGDFTFQDRPTYKDIIDVDWRDAEGADFERFDAVIQMMVKHHDGWHERASAYLEGRQSV